MDLMKDIWLKFGIYPKFSEFGEGVQIPMGQGHTKEVPPKVGTGDRVL